MTEKEIYENALNVYPYDIRGQYAYDANDDKRKGYIKGYKDAIGQLKQNPLDTMQEEPTTSVWHDASETPKEGERILVCDYTSSGKPTMVTMTYSSKDIRATIMMKVEKWAKVDELLKL